MYRDQLIKLGVKVKKGGGCCNKNKSTAYFLPFKINWDLEKFLQPLGKSRIDFKKTTILKIEDTKFLVSGIKGMSQVTLRFKNNNDIDHYIIEVLEKCLLEYIKDRKK